MLPHTVNWYYEINRLACIYCVLIFKVLFGSKPKEGIDALLPSNTQLSPYLRFGCLSPRLFHMRLTKAYIQVGFIAVIYLNYYLKQDMQFKLSSSVDTFCRSWVSVTWACSFLEWSLQAVAISNISDRCIFMGACAALSYHCMLLPEKEYHCFIPNHWFIVRFFSRQLQVGLSLCKSVRKETALSVYIKSGCNSS